MDYIIMVSKTEDNEGFERLLKGSVTKSHPVYFGKDLRKAFNAKLGASIDILK